MRADLRPGSVALIRRLGTLAAQRMRDRYEAIAAKLGVTPTAGAFPGALPEAYAEPRELAHLATDADVRPDRSPASVAEIASDVLCLFAARGALRPLRPACHRPRCTSSSTARSRSRCAAPDTVQRVRLAGPGRAVGHLGVLGAAPAVAEARARARTVLLELPWPRVHALLDGATDAARAFVLAFSEDVVRALSLAPRARWPRCAIASGPGRRAAAAGPGALGR